MADRVKHHTRHQTHGRRGALYSGAHHQCHLPGSRGRWRPRSLHRRRPDRSRSSTILEETTPPGQYPTVEEIQDVVEKVLIENGHAKVAKAYILYREERARRRREKAARGYRESSNIPWRKIYEVLRWSVDHDLHTVERLNARIASGRVPPHRPGIGSGLRGGHRHRRPAHRRTAGRAQAGHHRRSILVGQDDDDDQAGPAAGQSWPEPGHPERGQLLLRPGAASQGRVRRL